MSTYITDIMSLHDLNDMVAQKYVNVQGHPTLPLDIYDYSKGCMFDRMWNNVTLQCRGMIVERGTGRIVARGPNKFWNYGQPEATEHPLDSKVRMTTKMDGSLGIVWEYNGHYGVSTRGSFTSEQAIHATKLLNESLDFDFLRDDIEFYAGYFTPVVEIIYPENRIVLSYGDTDELASLGVVDNESGLIVIRSEKVAKGFMTLGEAIAYKIPDDEEGYVLDILDEVGESTDHIKLKGETYKMLHGILTETSGRRIWNQLVARECAEYIHEPRHWGSYLGADPEDIARIDTSIDLFEAIADTPDEFMEWVEAKVLEIKTSVQEFLDESVELSKPLAEFNGKERYLRGKHLPQYVEISRHLEGNPVPLILKAWKQAYPDGKDMPFMTSSD